MRILKRKLEAHLHAFKYIGSPMLNYPIRISAEIQHANCSVGYAIARHTCHIPERAVCRTSEA